MADASQTETGSRLFAQMLRASTILLVGLLGSACDATPRDPEQKRANQRAASPRKANPAPVEWPKGSVLGRLFEQPDDDLLIMGLLEPVEKRVRKGGLASLNTVQQNWLLAISASSLIGNGGFRYFFESADNQGDITVAALKSMGATKAARALQAAISFFPGGRPPKDMDKRNKFVADLTDKQREVFERGTELLYSEALDPIVATYARNNQAAFKGLPDPTDVQFPLDPPPANATDRQLGMWIQSMGGRCSFEGHVYKRSGWRKLFYPSKGLPPGKLVLKALSLPKSRRDIDKVIQHLCRWSRAGQIDELELVHARWLTSKGLSALKSLSGLRKLSLASSHLADTEFAALRDVSSLEHLDLRKTKISDEGLLELVDLKRLHTLDLAETLVRGHALKQFSRLRTLTLGWMAFDDNDLSFVDRMPLLVNLSVLKIPLTPAAIKRVAKLQALRDLTLWNNGLTEDHLAPLLKHPRLERVNLQGMKITVTGARILATLPIKWLMIGSVDVSPVARKILGDAFPKAQLHIGKDQ